MTVVSWSYKKMRWSSITYVSGANADYSTHSSCWAGVPSINQSFRISYLRSCNSDVYIAWEYYVGSAMSYGLPARNTQQRGRAILRGTQTEHAKHSIDCFGGSGHFEGGRRSRRYVIMDGIANHFLAKNTLDCRLCICNLKILQGLYPSEEPSVLWRWHKFCLARQHSNCSDFTKRPLFGGHQLEIGTVLQP